MERKNIGGVDNEFKVSEINEETEVGKKELRKISLEEAESIKKTITEIRDLIEKYEYLVPEQLKVNEERSEKIKYLIDQYKEEVSTFGEIDKNDLPRRFKKTSILILEN